MAQGTTDNPNDPARQAPMGSVPPPEPAQPVLFDDIDPVLLVRLYPGAIESSAARGLAMEAGQRAREEGMALVASQQEPVLTSEGVAAAPPLPERIEERRPE